MTKDGPDQEGNSLTGRMSRYASVTSKAGFAAAKFAGATYVGFEVGVPCL